MAHFIKAHVFTVDSFPKGERDPLYFNVNFQSMIDSEKPDIMLTLTGLTAQQAAKYVPGQIFTVTVNEEAEGVYRPNAGLLQQDGSPVS